MSGGLDGSNSGIEMPRKAAMAKIVKVKCTGAGQHENEVDLDQVIGSDVVIYGNPIATGRDIPARIVRRCDICDEGKVIVTREMIEQVL
jgi:hypothetical protein